MTAHAVSHPESRAVPAAVATGVLCVAAAAWVVLVHRMGGMDMAPPTPGGDPGRPGWFAVTWVVMTAAMMLPGSAAAVARAARSQRGRRGQRATLGASTTTAAAFVTAYAAVWLLAGLAGYACVQAVRALHVDALGWNSAGRYVAAAALIAAGLYQFTGVKRRWLARCIAPEHHRARPGLLGGLRAGAGHGVCCIACCGTLMVALYALGIMSITWMVLLTLLIAAERVAWPTPAAVAVVAAVLLGLGAGVAVAPSSVPGLHVPPPGDRAGMGMRMG